MHHAVLLRRRLRLGLGLPIFKVVGILDDIFHRDAGREVALGGVYRAQHDEAELR